MDDIDWRARAEKTERECNEAQQALALSLAAWDAAGMQGRDTATVTVLDVIRAVAQRDRRVRAEALREAAAALRDTNHSNYVSGYASGDKNVSDWIRARADEIERS